MSICSLFIVVYKQVKEQENYIEITASTKETSIEQVILEDKIKFIVNVVYEYIVDEKKYLTDKIKYSDFDSKIMAQRVADSLENHTRIVYYDPKDHKNNIPDRNIEAIGVISLMSTCFIIIGILLIVLRKNPIFCGISILGDIQNEFKKY